LTHCSNNARGPLSNSQGVLLEMSRLEGPRRADIASEEIQSVFQRLFGDRDPMIEPGTKSGTIGDWWTTFALEPGLFHLTELRHAWQSSPERLLNPVLRELAVARVGWARGSQFVFSQHCKGLRSAGASEDKIRSIPDWSTSGCFDEVERLVLAYTDDLVLGSGRCPDARFDALQAHLSDVEILELTFLICTYDMSAKISLALRMEFDSGPDRVVEVDPPAR
jgi:alkylhydroperoxidase family enzyme